MFLNMIMFYGIIISVIMFINCMYLIIEVIRQYELTYKELIISFIKSKGSIFIENKTQGMFNIIIWGFILPFVNWVLLMVYNIIM